MPSDDSPQARFLALHVPGHPLLMPNPWDLGSAKILQTLGFQALATTSAGFAGTLGRADQQVTRAEALEHARHLVGTVAPLPVSADLENGFGGTPEQVAETVRLAAEVGLAGCSIEDVDPATKAPYGAALAAERVAAAAEAAHDNPAGVRLVLTARADANLYGDADLDDTLARLQSFERAGADVLYAPAVSSVDGIRAITQAVTTPVNVLALPDAPPVAELAELGVARVSVGSGFYWAAMGGLVAAARELLDEGTFGFWGPAGAGRAAGREACG